MSLLEDLQRRARNWLVRAAFGADPRQLRDMLREVRNRSLRMHRLGLEIDEDLERFRQNQHDRITAVDERLEELAGQNLDAFLFVARFMLNEEFSRHLRLNLHAEPCPNCNAQKGTHCAGGDRVCVGRHVAAIESRMQRRADERRRREGQ